MNEASPRLRAPANRASRRAKTYWTVRALVGWLAVGVVVTVICVTVTTATTVAIAVVAVLLAAVHLTVMPQWRFRVHRWETTDTAVYTQSGWFNQERRIAPIARIQTVDTKRGVFEQLFGLSNVTITTASAAGPLTIHGLDREVADALVGDVTLRAQLAGGDGT